MDGAGAATEPIVDRVSSALDSAERTWQERPGARVRRVRRMGAQPLPYLMDVHPEARAARPVQVGLRSIDVADIAGTPSAGERSVAATSSRSSNSAGTTGPAVGSACGERMTD